MRGPLPSPLELLVLILAAMRLTRLVGWDEFPLAAKIREWAIGQEEVSAITLGEFVEHGAYVDEHGVTRFGTPPWASSAVETPDAEELGLPGKQPSTMTEGVRPTYRRQTLAHLVHCPWCIGFWISLTTYIGWLAAGDVAIYAAVPLAMSAGVGIISKNLDA